MDLTEGGKIIATVIPALRRERVLKPTMTFAEFERTRTISKPIVKGIHPSVLLVRERRGE